LSQAVNVGRVEQLTQYDIDEGPRGIYGHH
jgi:hypothetical protein